MRTVNEAIEVCVCVCGLHSVVSASLHRPLLAIIVCVRHHIPICLRTRCLRTKSEAKKPLALLEPWAATQPEDAEIWLALGYAALRSDDRFETLRAYGQALRLQPTNREAAHELAEVLLELGAPSPFRGHGGGLEADRRIIRKSVLCEQAGDWPDCAFAP